MFSFLRFQGESESTNEFVPHKLEETEGSLGTPDPSVEGAAAIPEVSESVDLGAEIPPANLGDTSGSGDTLSVPVAPASLDVAAVVSETLNDFPVIAAEPIVTGAGPKKVDMAWANTDFSPAPTTAREIPSRMIPGHDYSDRPDLLPPKPDVAPELAQEADPTPEADGDVLPGSDFASDYLTNLFGNKE